MTAQVKYLFGSLDTGEIIAELPMSGVSTSNKLNDWGTFRGTVYYDSSGIDNADIAAATIPGRCFVVVERDDVPIWDGIVWSAAYNSESKVLNVTGRTYEAFPDKQIVDSDLSWSQIEQRNIFCELWTNMQTPSYRNLGIQLPDEYPFPTIVKRDLNILATEYKTYYSGMSAMSDGEDGFDWTIATIRENNRYVRQLRIGYPYLGTVNSVGLSLDYPGNIVNYYQTGSMTNAATHVYVLGAGEGSDMVVGRAVQSDLLSTGHKRYDVTISRKDIETQPEIDSLAGQLGSLRRPPLNIYKVFMKADLDPEFGSYGLGDTAVLAIVDPPHPSGLQVSARIVSWEYRPPSDDTVEQVELVFEGDELNDG